MFSLRFFIELIVKKWCLDLCKIPFGVWPEENAISSAGHYSLVNVLLSQIVLWNHFTFSAWSQLKPQFLIQGNVAPHWHETGDVTWLSWAATSIWVTWVKSLLTLGIWLLLELKGFGISLRLFLFIWYLYELLLMDISSSLFVQYFLILNWSTFNLINFSLLC